MNKSVFFILVAAIFIFERVFQALAIFPIFIFPVFVVVLMLRGNDNPADLAYISVAGLFFDFFSGLKFGMATISILAVCLSIYFFKMYFSIGAGSFLGTAFLSAVFVLEYSALLSVISSSAIVVRYALLITGESVILASLIMPVMNKTKLFVQRR